MDRFPGGVASRTPPFERDEDDDRLLPDVVLPDRDDVEPLGFLDGPHVFMARTTVPTLHPPNGASPSDPCYWPWAPRIWPVGPSNTNSTPPESLATVAS